MRAAEHGLTTAAQALIARGADVNADAVRLTYLAYVLYAGRVTLALQHVLFIAQLLMGSFDIIGGCTIVSSDSTQKRRNEWQCPAYKKKFARSWRLCSCKGQGMVRYILQQLQTRHYDILFANHEKRHIPVLFPECVVREFTCRRTRQPWLGLQLMVMLVYSRH
jgi:hypothetical protein